MSNRNKRLIFRVTEHELNTILSKTKKANMTLSNYLRNTSMNKKINVIEGLSDLSTELRRIGGNLNQLTRLCNQGRIQCLELNGIRNSIASINVAISKHIITLLILFCFRNVFLHFIARLKNIFTF